MEVPEHGHVAAVARRVALVRPVQRRELERVAHEEDGAAWMVSMRTAREDTESRWIREATQYEGGTFTSEWLLPSAKV